MIRLLTKIVWGSLLAFACFQSISAEENNQPKIEVKGAGFFKDRLLMRQLESIFNEPR
jgi:hypothetical protein